MRLIDADENRENFMETVYEILADEPDNIKANLIIDAFDSMEVAYDADAVARELEELRNMERCDHSRLKFQKAIEIVKRGGRNE